MDYGLTFTIFSLAFMIMLLYAFNMKRRNYSVRTKIYILLIFSGMAFAIVEILGVIFLKYSDVFSYFAFFWQLRNIAIVIYVYFFICYYNLLIKGDSDESIWTTIKKNNLFKILAIVLTIIMGGYCILLDIKPMDINNMQYVRGIIAYVLLALTSLTVVFAIINAYKLRKTHKNETRTLVLIIILFIIVLPIQMKIQHVSFMPFITMFVTYVMYQNIENPNIYLLNEVKKLKIDVDNNNKVDFLFNMSNDLISPLNDIMSMCNMVSSFDINDKERLKNDLNSIKNASNILLDSIDNILNLSYSNVNNQKITNVIYSSLELFKQIENSALSRLTSKNVKFIMEIDDKISSKLKGDVNKIQRILFTVIDNATKNTSVGKITFNVSATTDKDIQILHFKIIDTGSGIKSEELDKILDDNANNELAVCKRYIKQMGGNFNIQSLYGAGCKVYIDLPQEITGNKLIIDDKKEDLKINSINNIDCSNYKVLLVDNDMFEIKLITEILDRYKFNVVSTTSSLNCIDRIKADEVYDMILLDHKLKDINGVETMKILRELDGYKLPIIVVLTANRMVGAKDMYINEGFDDYLSKPIDENQLEKIIYNKILKKKK